MQMLEIFMLYSFQIRDACFLLSALLYKVKYWGW